MANERIKPLGDTALRIEIGQGIDPEVNRRVHAACAAIERAKEVRSLQIGGQEGVANLVAGFLRLLDTLRERKAE